MAFTKSQFKTLADFFNDIAKGYFLGSVAGNAYLPTTKPLTRLGYSFAWIIASLFFLSLALICSKEANNE